MTVQELHKRNAEFFDRIGRKNWALSTAYRKGLRFDKAFGENGDKLNAIFMSGVIAMNENAASIHETCKIPEGMSTEQFEKYLSLIKQNYNVR